MEKKQAITKKMYIAKNKPQTIRVRSTPTTVGIEPYKN